MVQQETFKLIDFSFQDLQDPEGLERLDQKFLTFVAAKNKADYLAILNYRNNICSDESSFLLKIATYIDTFLAKQFNVSEYTKNLQQQWLQLDPIINFKNIIVIKEARRRTRDLTKLPDFASLHSWLWQKIVTNNDYELAVANYASILLADKEQYEEDLNKLISWSAHCLANPEAKHVVENWISFSLPKKTVSNDLIDYSKPILRDGFSLTDNGKSSREIKSDIDQCIFCHDKKGDFCSTGFPISKKEPELGFKVNELDNLLHGCPLEQKISEMNALKQEGYTIAPLAIVMRDNPTCALTGHRICNDCQKSCIFQKQEPVDVPQIETRILKDVLDLPWGVEIYDLLTKWNPLIAKDYILKPFNGYKVLIMGMGPAGMTLAHYLLMQGCAVTGMDGLKIEDLPQDIIKKPIRDFASICEDLASRDVLGFGGVAEYGITARWNKNYLKLVYISLMRRKYFSLIGSVRFGGTLTIHDAWQLGFDHLAIAVGAGLPKELNLPGSLAKGMRAANDFLMALHLTGAVQKNNISNLQVELPAVVVGGGLTGVDTATELQAFYIQQVERILDRYENVISKYGEQYISEYFTNISAAKLEVFLAHGHAVRKCRIDAKKNNVEPNFIPLLHSWGGVTIVYRKEMIASPAYRNNHYELQQALREGVLYAECCLPVAVLCDEDNYVISLQVKDSKDNDAIKAFKARNVFVATGAKPNVAYGFEHASDLQRTGFAYNLYEESDIGLLPKESAKHCKDNNISVLSSYDDDAHRVSVIGDTNPAFHGSVVKAIASAKVSYSKIITALEKLSKPQLKDYHEHVAQLNSLKQSRIVALENSGNYLKIKIHAPFALQNFQPGNFFRVQNYNKTTAHNFYEPVTVFPSNISEDKKTFTCYLEKKSIKALGFNWEVGSKIAVMGPTGVRTSVKDYHKNTLMFLDASQIGSGLIMAKAIKNNNYNVSIVLVCKQNDIHAKQELLEIDNDLIITDNFESLGKEVMEGYTSIIIKGKHQLISKVKKIYQENSNIFSIKPNITATVLGPMQCMLKGICAQCLQWQIDPATGLRTKAVYSCSWQEQPLEIIAIDHLEQRNDNRGNVVAMLNHIWLDEN